MVIHLITVGIRRKGHRGLRTSLTPTRSSRYFFDERIGSATIYLTASLPYQDGLVRRTI
jgi:hypothetical protein